MPKGEERAKDDDPEAEERGKYGRNDAEKRETKKEEGNLFSLALSTLFRIFPFLSSSLFFALDRMCACLYIFVEIFQRRKTKTKSQRSGEVWRRVSLYLLCCQLKSDIIP